MLACVPQEIVYYAPFHDAYLVWHRSGIEAWFKKPLVEESLLEAYAEHRRKRKREDEEEAKLVKLMLESVSEDPQSITWGDCPAHIKALQADGYMPGVKKDWQPKRDSMTNVYERYPPRAMMNGHNIPLLASLMPGVVINVRARACLQEPMMSRVKYRTPFAPRSTRPSTRCRSSSGPRTKGTTQILLDNTS